jgi:hypothetical protein
MIVIKIYIYFTLLLPATFFGSLCQGHLQAELYFLKKVTYTIDNSWQYYVLCAVLSSFYVSRSVLFTSVNLHNSGFFFKIQCHHMSLWTSWSPLLAEAVV